MRVGIIAEDDSDVAVVRELTATLLRPRSVGYSWFVGNGCGKLRRKCAAWSGQLISRGCPCIVVIHDLDVSNETALRAELAAAIAPSRPRASVILIPRREIEAWLLYDGRAIARAFRQTRQPRLPGNPESLSDPKRHLRETVKKSYGRDYVSTLHNGVIARCIDPGCLSPSVSFAPHLSFAREVRRMIR
jgi:hypothetical protein